MEITKEENQLKEVEENLIKQPNFKLYKRRWFILLLYVLYMLCNSSQWLQYSMIPNAVMKFYGVSNWHVNLSSLLMMALYVPLALPAAKLMDRISLRWTAILGSAGTTVGSWVKVFSAKTNRFPVTLIGQTIVAISQVLMLSVPQKLSSTWFGEYEVSTACSIGVFGFQLGIVFGLFLPPVLVKNHDDINLIGLDLFYMFISFACVTSFIAILVIFFFAAEPPLPPTSSQALIRMGKSKIKIGYLKNLKRIFSNRHLCALFMTTGVNNGCFNGLSTLLSQIFLEYFPGLEQDAGRIGVTMVVFGMTASVLFGFILDRTKKFKLVLITVYYMSSLSMLILTFILYTKKIYLMYFAAAFVGTFLCGFTAVSFDVATELTYPESELIVGTIMNMMSLLFTFAATLIFGLINNIFGYFWGNIGFVVTLAIGSTCTIPIKFDLKRTTAQRQGGTTYFLK